MVLVGSSSEAEEVVVAGRGQLASGPETSQRATLGFVIVIISSHLFSTAKRCSSSQSVPGSHPIPSHPHIALVVLICSKLCLNGPD